MTKVYSLPKAREYIRENALPVICCADGLEMTVDTIEEAEIFFQGDERCWNCQVNYPERVVKVTDAHDPHCIDCGRPILS